MKITIFKDYTALSEFVADEMVTLIRNKPAAVICLASGDSPKLTCELFTQEIKQQHVDISKFFFVGLDEWVGLAPKINGSCHSDLKKRIFDPLNLSSTQYHLFDALSANLQEECKKMDAIIHQKGGIDLMIVGIGMNGHIGFNEPGINFELLSHVTDLDDTTISVGQKYFDQPVELKKGITLGFEHLMNAKKVFLIASGKRKAAIIKKAVEEPINNLLPASILQKHPNGYVFLDVEAADLIENS